MENRRNHNSTVAPRMSELFPHAVIAHKFVFLSGTPGLVPSTGKLAESFEEQTRQAFLNIKTILEEVGSGLEIIVKTTIPGRHPGVR
jgi:2-iminobutanoate/2-iminopropanoate deaminase